MIRKGIQFLLLTLLAYLLQSTAARPLAIGGVAPNFAIAIISVISVAMGRKYTFIMSLAVGYCLEIMLPSLDYIYLILYPVCAVLGVLAFGDKSERRLEEERTSGQKKVHLPAHLRTMLCALVSITVFESVNLLYIYLSGIKPDMGHYSRALICIVYTTALAGILQFPIRWRLGMYKLKKAASLRQPTGKGLVRNGRKKQPG